MSGDPIETLSLPAEFKDLERFVPKWGLTTELERNRVRRASSMAELDDLYKTMRPRLDEIIDYLDPIPLNRMPDDAKRLLRITLSLMEIAHAVEVVSSARPPNAFDADRVEFLVNDRV
ncbi:MAG: hypothetical protein IVW54_02300 [Candidatus Binataceae bacterium]|nr:hypothetical protein [Candidatus Binataceae bacterium]